MSTPARRCRHPRGRRGRPSSKAARPRSRRYDDIDGSAARFAACRAKTSAVVVAAERIDKPQSFSILAGPHPAFRRCFDRIGGQVPAGGG